MPTRSMLVSFPGYPNEAFNLVPDNGLANLAACLIRAGHDTTIWDCSTVTMMHELYPYHERENLDRLVGRIMDRIRARRQPDKSDLQAFYALEDRIDGYQDRKIRQFGRRMAEFAHRERLDFIGFKLWTGSGFRGAILLAEEIKRMNPSVKIFGGGPHVDWFMQRSFNVTDAFDILAYGEGEEVIVQLAEHAEGKRHTRDVANIIYRRAGRLVTNPQSRVQDLDSLPLPCYDEDVYPAMRGDEKIKVILLDESRGCPNSCNFCIHPLKSGRRRRMASAKGFVNRLEKVIQRYGFRSFRFAGSNPPAGLRKEIAAEIVRRGLGVSFCGFAHVRGAKLNDFPLLKKAGCRALAFGVESGSQRILDGSMNKRVKVEDIRSSLAACKEAGIATIVSVIVPAPHETEETKEETFGLLCETRPDAAIVSFPALMPGTTWEQEKDRFGFEVRDPEMLFRKAMTHRVSHFAPAALWRPLKDYRLNGKTFHEIGRETAEFVQRVKKAGIATQLFDQIFLMSEFAEMPAVDFGELVSHYMANGQVDEMRVLLAKINRNVLEGAGVAYS